MIGIHNTSYASCKFLDPSISVCHVTFKNNPMIGLDPKLLKYLEPPSDHQSTAVSGGSQRQSSVAHHRQTTVRPPVNHRRTTGQPLSMAPRYHQLRVHREDVPKTAFRTHYGHYERYDCEIHYHPGKVNVVTDALSLKERVKPVCVREINMTICLNIKGKILKAQKEALKEVNLQGEALRGLDKQKEYKEDNAAEHHRPSSLLQQPEIPEWKLTKSNHFLAIREYYLTTKHARIYINEVVARHGVPISIISNCDSRFTSRFWQMLQKALGTHLNMSTTYHPQTDGQSERTIQTMKDMLRSCELKICEAKTNKYSINEPPEVELKDLPPHLEYAFLEGDDKLLVIIAKDLSAEEKTALITEDFEPAVEHQIRANLKIHDVIKNEVLKILDAGLLYPISDSPWVSPVHCVPKKGGFTVVEYEENELIPTRLVTGWRVYIDYRKLNEATLKDHFLYLS
uniref:Reverse transcriptase domain-containing protein n=1 Tax=Tanacetum cinerariifolium TaxID=118510 RepID=A0A6L2P7U9_TANCI|nr:reverse transcriptase domain-containing protein [Tanacetum cinerariifolium]